MTLNNDIIRLTYFLAGKIRGRKKHIDHQDIAHEAFLRIMRREKPVPEQHLSTYIGRVVQCVYREFYTDKTDRKHDVMLTATRELPERSYIPDTWVDTLDEALHAVMTVWRKCPRYADYLTDFRAPRDAAKQDGRHINNYYIRRKRAQECLRKAMV